MAPTRPDLRLQVRHKGCLNQSPLTMVGRNGPGGNVRIGGLGEAQSRAPALIRAHDQGSGGRLLLRDGSACFK
jgi:hypothetical protein